MSRLAPGLLIVYTILLLLLNMTDDFITQLGALLAVLVTILSLLAVVYKIAKTESNIYMAIARLETKMFEALDRQHDKVIAKISPLEQSMKLERSEILFRYNELLAHVRDLENFLQKDGFTPRTPITYDK